jgi:hypothetical protein
LRYLLGVDTRMPLSEAETRKHSEDEMFHPRSLFPSLAPIQGVWRAYAFDSGPIILVLDEYIFTTLETKKNRSGQAPKGKCNK